MESSETQTANSVALFESTCEALDVPVGAQRLEAFLKLPAPQRKAILAELAAEAQAEPHIPQSSEAVSSLANDGRPTGIG